MIALYLLRFGDHAIDLTAAQLVADIAAGCDIEPRQSGPEDSAAIVLCGHDQCRVCREDGTGLAANAGELALGVGFAGVGADLDLVEAGGYFWCWRRRGASQIRPGRRVSQSDLLRLRHG